MRASLRTGALEGTSSSTRLTRCIDHRAPAPLGRAFGFVTSCRHVAVCAANSEGKSEGGGDIDALALLLSAKAAELRASMSDEDLQRSLDGEESAETIVRQPPPTASAMRLSAELEMRVFQEIGDGGFVSDDFEILQQLGRISIQEAGSPMHSAGTPQTAVIAYAARFIPRLAYSRPVTTMLKEYLPVAKAIAFNELLLLQHLCGIPEDKYFAADKAPIRTPPVVPLLGYFSSAPSEDGSTYSTDVEQDSVWLVYKWEGLRPLGLYLEAGPPRAVGGFLKTQAAAEAEAWARRTAMLRGVAAQLLTALDFVHSADVVHGSLSTGSVFMNTSEDLAEAEDLMIKLDNFGFGKWFTAAAPLGPSTTTATSAGAGYGPVELGAALEEGKRTDLQASALVLAETFCAGLANSPSGVLTRSSLQRLLFEVFHEDVAAFKAYCQEDADGSFARMVEFLDEGEGAGWDLLGKLMQGKTSALELSQHRFLGPRRPPSRRVL